MVGDREPEPRVVEAKLLDRGEAREHDFRLVRRLRARRARHSSGHGPSTWLVASPGDSESSAPASASASSLIGPKLGPNRKSLVSRNALSSRAFTIRCATSSPIPFTSLKPNALLSWGGFGWPPSRQGRQDFGGRTNQQPYLAPWRLGGSSTVRSCSPSGSWRRRGGARDAVLLRVADDARCASRSPSAAS